MKETRRETYRNPRSADAISAARDENAGAPRTEISETFAHVICIRWWYLLFKEIVE